MPQRRCSFKRLRVDRKKYHRNLIVKREIKKSIKSFQEMAQKKDSAHAESTLRKITSLLDKAVSKGILKKNTVARKKSQLALQLKSIS